jgi:hypothetical protein
MISDQRVEEIRLAGTAEAPCARSGSASSFRLLDRAGAAARRARKRLRG